MRRKIVIDTNVLISAAGWKGNARKVLELCIEGNLLLLESPGMLEEIEDVLRRQKFKFIPRAEKKEFLKHLTSVSKMVHPKEKPKVIKEDPADDKFLWCALAGNAEFIVSGDSHLLALKEFRGIKILAPKDFLNLILRKT